MFDLGLLHGNHRPLSLIDRPENRVTTKRLKDADAFG
jgi:hypothetical protein